MRTIKKINPALAGQIAPLVDLIAEGTRRPEGAVTIYRGPRNLLYCLNPDSPDNPLDVAVNVKNFRIPPFPNNFAYRLLRPSKARRSYDNACGLLSLGFHTPEPMAWVEKVGALTLGRSYYLCRQLPLPNIRNWHELPFADDLARALGAEMVRLHRAGVWFRDFSEGNILYERLADGSFRFYYVDLNRMAFGVTSHRKQMAMFRALSPSQPHVALVARYYAEAAGLDPAATAREASRLQERFFSRHHRKEKIKQRLRKTGQNR